MKWMGAAAAFVAFQLCVAAGLALALGFYEAPPFIKYFTTAGVMPLFYAGGFAAWNLRDRPEKPTAALSGALAARGNPAGMMGLQMLQQRRQQAMQEQQYGQRREDEFQDWVRKQAYEAANPSPVNNDTVNDYNFIRQTLGDDEGANYLRNKANPPQLQYVPGVGLVSIPRGQPQQAPAAGPGVTFTPIDDGGPAPQGPGGFR